MNGHLEGSGLTRQLKTRQVARFLSKSIQSIAENTFTFSHFADAFIQSDLQLNNDFCFLSGRQKLLAITGVV